MDDCMKNIIKKFFTKDREEVISSTVDGIVKDIVGNYEHKFSYDEQAEILKRINEAVLDKKKDKRNELIVEAREVQDSIKKLESNE